MRCLPEGCWDYLKVRCEIFHIDFIEIAEAIRRFESDGVMASVGAKAFEGSSVLQVAEASIA